MKKVIALVLGLIMMILYYLFSFIGYTSSWFSPNHEWGDDSKVTYRSTYVKLVSDRCLIFDKNDIELDMFIGIYDENNRGNYILEDVELAIYISNDRSSTIGCNWDGYAYLNDIREIENVDGKKFVRRVSNDEVYEFGYTEDDDNYGDLIYNHSEKITIPKEFFNENNNTVYIQVTEFFYCEIKEDEKDKGNIKIWVGQTNTVGIKYYLVNDKIIFSVKPVS